MRDLPTHFRHDGFTYTQLARTGRVALYEQRFRPDVCAYEVIIVQDRPARQMPSGAWIAAGEYFPSASQWGRSGWTFRRLDLAQAHMAALMRTEGPGLRTAVRTEDSGLRTESSDPQHAVLTPQEA